MANLTNPVKHQADDTGIWRRKWSDDRRPQALAVGAQGATEAKLIVKHDIKDQNELKFSKSMFQEWKKRVRGKKWALRISRFNPLSNKSVLSWDLGR